MSQLHVFAIMTQQGKSSCATFRAGNYEFTRLQARQCAILHQNGSTLWQIKEQHHRNATLEQKVVAIQVRIMWNFSIEQLPAHIFDPNLVCTEVWRVVEPSKNNE